MIINETYFKKYSPIPLNYNMAELKNYIEVAAEIWVKPLIGSDLYDEIEDQVERNEVTQPIAALLTEGKLWQYLSFATCLEGLVFIWADFSERGITKASKNEFSEGLDKKDLVLIQDHLRRQVEFLKDSVKKYICEHSDYFPNADFCSCGCSCCNNGVKPLNAPNRYQQLYRPRRIIKDLI